MHRQTGRLTHTLTGRHIYPDRRRDCSLFTITDIQIDGQTHIRRQAYTHTQTDRQTDTNTEIRQTEIHTCTQIDRQANVDR